MAKRRRPTGDPEIDFPRGAVAHSDAELTDAAASSCYLGWAAPAVGFQRFVIARWRRGKLRWGERGPVIFFICQSSVIGGNLMRREAIFHVPERRSPEPWKRVEVLSPIDRLVVRLLRCRPPRDPEEPVDPRRFIGVNILGTARWLRGRNGVVHGVLDRKKIRLATRGEKLEPYDNRLLTGSPHPKPSP